MPRWQLFLGGVTAGLLTAVAMGTAYNAIWRR